jgi:hypothetical protein
MLVFSSRKFTRYAIPVVQLDLAWLLHLDDVGQETGEEGQYRMRIHTYSAGSETATTHPEVSPSTRLRELVISETDTVAYQVGNDVEVDVELTVTEIFGDGNGHVIVHPCREITVTVDYAGTDKVIRARPSARIGEIRSRAIAELGLDPQSSADLVLRLPGTTEELPEASPVGAYVPRGTCALTLDLVHASRPQG